ncbi:hypothetical protein MKX03_036979 [Papaver bracteatum]|nr:hypothetical protein MKX03_036979 [Papaver bracteatum]
MGVNTNGDIGNVVSADVKSNEDCVLAASVATNGKLAVRADVAKVMPLMVNSERFNFDMPAMLTVEDDEFWDGVSPVQFGSLPALQDAVTVVGYPIGGDIISVTSGVVSRMKIFPYEHGSTELLGLQGKCVGIAFQTIKREDVENMGYVIPTTVVMYFIEDCDKKEEYTGFPTLGVEWQKMENPDLRAVMGMTSQ